jgi:hypothetical protein
MTVRTIFILGLRPNFSARAIGISEAILGALMVLTLAIAWRIA